MPVWLGVAIVLLIAALVLQIVLPRIGERRIERRLTENGGDAFVALVAFPAARLLRHGGDRIVVRGRRLSIGMSKEGGGLGVLDGFEQVDIALGEFRTGPFEVASFELIRSGDGPYLMRSQARTSGEALAHYGGAQLGGMALLLGPLARQAPLTSRSFAVSIEVELSSQEGVLAVASGGGTVAGYPAGPIATTIAAAVARRLEISF